MSSRQRDRFVRWQTAWMLVGMFALLALDALSVARFVAVSLLGLLVLVQFTAPLNVTPRWRQRLGWLVTLALVGFGLLVVGYVVGILPSGLV